MLRLLCWLLGCLGLIALSEMHVLRIIRRTDTLAVLRYAHFDAPDAPFDDKRRWRLYGLVAPSEPLSPLHLRYNYPFSVKVIGGFT